MSEVEITIECPECSGRGEVLVAECRGRFAEVPFIWDECPACRGLGVVDGSLITDQVEPLSIEEEERFASLDANCGCVR